jgi:hypothetical protein
VPDKLFLERGVGSGISRGRAGVVAIQARDLDICACKGLFRFGDVFVGNEFDFRRYCAFCPAPSAEVDTVVTSAAARLASRRWSSRYHRGSEA